MLDGLKQDWKRFVYYWHRFEIWFASKIPGLKTKLVALLGGIGSLALLLQEYVAGLPLEKFLTPNKILVVNIVLFTLVFWFRSLTNKEIK